MNPTIALGITTSPRQKDYLTDSIRSLRSAGFDELVHLFAEPGTPECDLAGTRTIVNPRRLGCAGNWKNALASLLAERPADWYLLLQDDVVWRPNSKEVLVAEMQTGARGIGFLSAYTSPAMVPRRPASGWQPALFPNPSYWGICKFWGALALAIPHSAALRLVDCPRYQAHQHPRKLDELLGDCCRDLDLACRVYVPSLADHIGEVSTLGRHGWRFFGNRWGRRGIQFRPEGVP